MWMQDDFKVDGEMWPKIWQYYGEGPDWNIERPLCMAALDAWRARILAKPTQGKAAIVNELSNNNNVFNGFGRHLANDFCFELVIFPGMPAIELCRDDSLFGDLRARIGPYMDQWASAEYLTRCSIEPNTNNPLSFNTWSNEVYYSMYIKVFRKSCNARILPALYNKYVERGLLDPKHTIGKSYQAAPDVFCTHSWKQLAVYWIKDIKGYTVIRAKPPASWPGAKCEKKPAVDIREAGYSTTIGVAEFHELKMNKPNPITAVDAAKKRRGRPPKTRTGKAGKPRKEPTTEVLTGRLKKRTHVLAVKARADAGLTTKAISKSKPVQEQANSDVINAEKENVDIDGGRVMRSHSNKGQTAHCCRRNRHR
ncbi:hypothetical protein OF83DRAFT_114326 [Amylostereum chailletii]|nr:hypothetical protein OF83DRAFT_114326 [Amylostereum chailletii]